MLGFFFCVPHHRIFRIGIALDYDFALLPRLMHLPGVADIRLDHTHLGAGGLVVPGHRCPKTSKVFTSGGIYWLAACAEGSILVFRVSSAVVLYSVALLFCPHVPRAAQSSALS